MSVRICQETVETPVGRYAAVGRDERSSNIHIYRIFEFADLKVSQNLVIFFRPRGEYRHHLECTQGVRQLIDTLNICQMRYLARTARQ